MTPEIREQGWEEIFDRVYRTGEPMVSHEWHTQLHHPDGTTSAYYFNLDVRPLRDPEGSVVGITLRLPDVTDAVLARQRTEAELRSVSTRYERAREVVAALQQALLPDRVPVVQKVQIAAHHLLAGDEATAGGDWYDIVERDGRLVLAVGDVVGHGVKAAAEMGQVRAVLLDRLREGVSIAEAAAGLDRRAAHEPASFGTTLCLVDLDLDSGAFEYVTAGHPPPLVIEGSGVEATERYLVPSGAGPLGTMGAVVPASGHLGPAGCIVMYTDGIVELPGTEPTQATVELAQTARRAFDNRALPLGAPLLPVERVTSQGIELLTRAHGYADDLTLVAAQRVAEVRPLELTMPANRAAVRRVHDEVTTWLGGLHARPDDAAAVLHAAVELVQNAVDHAYLHGPPGDIRLDLALEPTGTAALTISDAGRWREREASVDRGLGLALVRMQVDSVDARSSDVGTTVAVHHRLSRPAGSLSGAPPPRAEARGPFEAWTTEGSDGLLHVGAVGPLDAESVEELRAQVILATAPGQPPALLELGGLTLLSSAGVHLILRAKADNPSLEVAAPAGSVAQHVLSLVGLPHTTGP